MRLFFVLLNLLLLLLPAANLYAVQDTFLQNTHAPFRIAILESGNFWNYNELTHALTYELGRESLQDRITFPPELHCSMPATTEYAAARELMTRKDVDAILALGTPAVYALLRMNNGKTPVIGINVTNPDILKLKTAGQQPAASNFFWYDQENQFYQATVLAHRLLPFKRLGVMFRNSAEGETFAAIDEMREAARGIGFDLVEFNGLDGSEASCRKGVQTLINQGVDAFFIPQYECFAWNKPDPAGRTLLETLHAANIRTYSGIAGGQVWGGALMGVFGISSSAAGRYFVNTLIQVLHLPAQEEKSPEQKSYLRIAFNLDTAHRIGLELPMHLMIIADGMIDHSLPPVYDFPGKGLPAN